MTDVRAITAVSAVLALLAGGGGWFAGQALAGNDPPQAKAIVTPTPTSTATKAARPPAPPTAAEILARAKLATVRLSPEGGSYRGSGTVISAGGLILTNAHVAVPQAPGLAVVYKERPTEPDPTYLTVSVNPPGDVPAVERYRASPLVADGYLDLAVLQITALADGSPLPAGTVFPYLPLAGLTSFSTGDPLTILGYPAVSGQGVSLSVTRGEVRNIHADLQDKRAKEPRWEIETSGAIAGGNSGGAAINARGQLLGVPSAVSAGKEYSGKIRPAALAAPLLLAVATEKPYRTPYDVLGTGHETAKPLGWSTNGSACDAPATTLGSGSFVVQAAATLTGMTQGEDVYLELTDVGTGEPLDTSFSTWSGAASACLAHDWVAGDPDGFVEGDYTMAVYAGPTLRLLTTVPITIVVGD